MGMVCVCRNCGHRQDIGYDQRGRLRDWESCDRCRTPAAFQVQRRRMIQAVSPLPPLYTPLR